MTATSTRNPQTTTTRPPEELPRMSFGDHLDELRRRLIRSIGALLVAALVITPFKNEVTAIYTAPYELMWMEAYETFLDNLDAEEAAAKASGTQLHELKQRVIEFHHQYRAAILDGTFPEDLYGTILETGQFRIPRTLKALGGLDDFWVFMGAVLLFALILASPVVLYQAWAFVAAGLYVHERKVVLRYFPFAVGLLTVGVLFGYLIVVPAGLFFLIKLMNWAKVEPMLSVSLYFSFLLTLTAALGAVFQLPLVMLALQKVGLVSHTAMKRNWRYVILGMFVAAAIFTPPDPFTQILMAVPMVVLYALGLILTGRAERRRNAAQGAH